MCSVCRAGITELSSFLDTATASHLAEPDGAGARAVLEPPVPAPMAGVMQPKIAAEY